jgi:eukaryotic-like serine/threonine-protein kinase
VEPGAIIGPYRIDSLLGVGGMGHVYRARDTRLNRDVALKMLPHAFAADPDRMARFTREAQTLAALNHPHIAQVYGLEVVDGVHALAMEFVNGGDLTARIARGPLPWDEVLPIAQQIVKALEAAHSQDIVHRDLKPANVRLKPDGTVKVLDFGLAKAVEVASHQAQAGSLTQSPTITSPAMTAAGMILGTAAYMAPEQARGKPVDTRADLWAFGCVVYEMLTGSRSFRGDDVTETLAAVLKSEPDWTALPGDLPIEVRHLLARCLEKDPSRRVASASTLAYVLDEPKTLSPAAVPSTVRHGAWGRREAVLAALAATFATLIAAAVWMYRPTVTTRVTSRLVLSSGDGEVTVGRNRIAVSPDGRQLVYYVNNLPQLRDLSTFALTAIPSTFTGQAAFSPDSRSLAAWSNTDNTIKRIDVGSSAVLTVCSSPIVSGMSWDADGIISGLGAEGILRCPLDGTAPQRLVTMKHGEEADGPQTLPGGNDVLFSVAQVADGATRWDSAKVVVQSLKTGERTIVVDGGNSGQYLASGHLVYARGGIVFAARFDPAQKKILGQAKPVIEGIRRAPGANVGTQFAISRSGDLFYIPGPATTGIPDRTLAISDRSGRVTRLSVPPGPYTQTRVSRDGTRLAVGTDDNKDATIWIYALDGKAALQKLTLEGHNRYPIWSPDGKRVAFQSDRGGDFGIFVQRVDGAAPVERVTTAPPGQSHVPNDWSPDGGSMIVAINEGERSSLSVLSLADRSLSPFVSSEGRVKDAAFSPDGAWVAYSTAPLTTITAPTHGVFVRSFPDGARVHQTPKVVIDFHPVWASNAELIYVTTAAAGRFASVRMTTAPGVAFSEPEFLPARVTGNRVASMTRAYDLLKDGGFVGIVDGRDANGVGTGRNDLHLVLNWFEELRQLVPLD